MQIPVLPTVGEGALPRLVSLQLLCEDLVDFSGIRIEYLSDLQEVALDSMVSAKTVEMYVTAAKKHPKRPKVLFLKRIDPGETKSTVKYVATDGPMREKASSIEFNQVQLTQNMLQNECIISLDQSSSMSKLSSAMKKIIVSEPPPAAPELSSAGNSVLPPSASIC